VRWLGAGADAGSVSEDVGVLSGKQPKNHVQVEARKFMKWGREMWELWRKLEKLEGEVMGKRVEMCRRMNGMRCETEAVRRFCF